jgi:hypothetical protein
MRTVLYSILIVSCALVAGFFLAKTKYFSKDGHLSVDMAMKYEKIRSVDMAKNAYTLGCLQSFERVCSLLKKAEADRCSSYSGSYCSDASSDYAIRLKNLLHGPN